MKKHAVVVTRTYQVTVSRTVFFTEDVGQPADLDLTHKWVRKACDEAWDELAHAFHMDIANVGQEDPYSVDDIDFIDGAKEIREYEVMEEDE